MSLFKTERPSRDKEKAIRALQGKDTEIVRIGLKIPLELKRRLKMSTARHNVSYAEVIISLIEKHLEKDEREEAK